MKKIVFIAFFASLISLLTSCAVQDLTSYKDAKPELNLMKYFVGTTDAWGIFQQRSGKVAKRFQVEMVGTEMDGKLILDEHFTYDDGVKQQRTWTLWQLTDGSWRGTASDVVGEAVGHVSGNALHWQYVLALPVDGKTYQMHVDDWMYLMDDKAMINRTSLKKFGIEFGQVTLFFKKRS